MAGHESEVPSCVLVEEVSAAERNLALCLRCHALTPCQPGERVPCCRCGGEVALRKPHSLTLTWFYTILATLALIPANIYPIMTILNFGRGDPSTIIEGVVLLIHYKMVPIAIVVFIASFLVPVGKLISLYLLLVSVQFRTNLCPVNRTRLYRVVEFIGRWSMLDIFVVTLLVALVHLGQVASVEPGLGALAFAIAVIITMFAASCFDPRLIWDAEKNDERNFESAIESRAGNS